MPNTVADSKPLARWTGLFTTSLILCSMVACGGNRHEQPGAAGDTSLPAPGRADTATHAPSTEPWRDTAGCARSYAGTIDTTIGITMRLCRNGENLAGSYRYVKVGKEIEIQGHVGEDGEFILYEWGNGGSKKQTGNWLGHITGDSVLEGTWSTVAGDRTMPFRVTLVGSGASAATRGGGFGGSWSYEKDGYSFTLDLIVRGDSIVGEHCAVTKNATRLDCSADEETGQEVRDRNGDFKNPSIRGTISGTKAMVGFKSYYGVDSAMNPITGTATMTLDGDRLAWKITDFTPGDFYLPMEATLRRDRAAGR